MLDEAQALVNKEECSEEDTQRIAELIQGARDQLAMAEALGYGTEDENFRKQIAELERKSRGDESTQGVFAKLRASLDRFRISFFEQVVPGGGGDCPSRAPPARPAPTPPPRGRSTGAPACRARPAGPDGGMIPYHN